MSAVETIAVEVKNEVETLCLIFDAAGKRENWKDTIFALVMKNVGRAYVEGVADGTKAMSAILSKK